MSVEQTVVESPELIVKDIAFGEACTSQEMKHFQLTDTFTITNRDPEFVLASNTAFIDFSSSFFSYDLTVAEGTNTTDKYFLDDSAHAVFSEYFSRLDNNQTKIDDISGYNVLAPLTLDFASKDWVESIGGCLDSASTGVKMIRICLNGLTMTGYTGATAGTATLPNDVTNFGLHEFHDYRSYCNMTGTADGIGTTFGYITAQTYRHAFRPLGFFRTCGMGQGKYFPLFLSGSMLFHFRIDDNPRRPYVALGATNFNPKMSAAMTLSNTTITNFTLNARLLYYDANIIGRFKANMSQRPIPFPYNTWLHNVKSESALAVSTDKAISLPISALSMRSFFVVPIITSYGTDSMDSTNRPMPQLTMRTSFNQGSTYKTFYQLAVGDKLYPQTKHTFSVGNQKEVLFDLLRSMSKINDISTGCRFNENNFGCSLPQDTTNHLAYTGTTIFYPSKFAWGYDLETYNNDDVLSGQDTRTGNPNIVWTFTPSLAATINCDIHGYGLINAKLYLTSNGSLVWK